MPNHPHCPRRRPRPTIITDFCWYFIALVIGLFYCCVSAKCQTAPLPHPRMGLNAALLGQIDTLRTTQDPAWTRFTDWLARKKAGTSYYTYIGNDDDALLLGYVTTQDKALFDLALADLAKVIYAPDGTLRQFYNPDCAAGALYCNLHDSAYKGGGQAALVAKLFDYGHDALTAQQRTDIVTWLNQAADALTANVNAATYFRNDGAITVRGLNAIYLATLGENPKADSISSAWHAAWAEQVKALTVMSDGGGMGEGNGYGALTMASIVDIANSTYYGTGEDLFVSAPAFRARLAYDAFSAYPKRIYDKDDPFWPNANPMNEVASIAGDSVRQDSWPQAANQPTGRMLRRRFAGTEEANLWNWVFGRAGTNAVHDPWVELYTYSPQAPPTKPTRLSWYAPGTGMIYVIQNWESQDATWIASWSGPHWDLHQHLDQGAFDLAKRRNLLPSTGDYDVSGLGPVHNLAYQSRTVATNNILVGDPNEYVMGEWAWMGCGPANTEWATKHDLFPLPIGGGKACIPNDGGQRTSFPFSMALFSVADYTSNRAAYDIAKVVSFSDTGTVAQWTMDTTKAYTNPASDTFPLKDGTTFVNPSKAKVNEVKRRMVYLRDADVFLVADTVESTNPAFKKSVLFHSLAKLEVLDGGRTDVSPGEATFTGATALKITLDDTVPSNRGATSSDYRSGYAAAFVQPVFPVGVGMRVVGGRVPSDVDHQAQGQPDPTAKQGNHFHAHIKDFWVDDYSDGVPGRADQHSANWPPIYPVNRSDIWASMSGGFGLQRVHMQPPVPATRDYFLNVIQPTLDPAAQKIALTRQETDTTFGVAFAVGGNSYTVMFPKTGDGPAVINGSAPVSPVVPPAVPPAVVVPPAPVTSPVVAPGAITAPSARLAAIAAALSAISAQLAALAKLLGGQ